MLIKQITASEISLYFTERWNGGNPPALAGVMRFPQQNSVCFVVRCEALLIRLNGDGNVNVREGTSHKSLFRTCRFFLKV